MLEAVSPDAVDVGAAVERISGSISAVDERQSSIAARTADDESRSGALDVRRAVDALSTVATDLTADVQGFVLAQ